MKHLLASQVAANDYLHAITDWENSVRKIQEQETALEQQRKKTEALYQCLLNAKEALRIALKVPIDVEHSNRVQGSE